jgi:futalosine hydrolase
MAESGDLPVNVLICTATEFEAGLLRRELADVGGVRLVKTGVGPVNAAHGTTLAIAESRPDVIICCGIGGAYPSSGLAIGDAVCASDEIYGDLGADSPDGFLDMRQLGFAVAHGDTPLFNEIPMQVFPLSRRARFVTVSTCTGTESAARHLEARTQGVVENMEGAAVAHVAYLHQIPVGEVRGISNIVTNRDTASWRVAEAAFVAQQAVIQWVRTLCPTSFRT